MRARLIFGCLISAGSVFSFNACARDRDPLANDTSLARTHPRVDTSPPLPYSASPHANTVTQSGSTKTSSQSGGCSGYQSLVANVWIGKELFLASDCSPIGTIADVQEDYHFPDGSIRDAILVSFNDGSADWIPRKAAQLLYKTR